MKKILFRVSISPAIGYGHLMRCLTFAEKFFKDEIYFAIEYLDTNINNLILNKSHKIILLNKNLSEELIDLIKAEKFDVLVFDSYYIDYEYEKRIKESCDIKVISFDDTYKKHYCDVLINHNIYASENRYKKLVPIFTKVLCGSRYTLIRKEFLKYRYLKRESKSFEKVLISLGAADFNNITLKVLYILRKIKNLEIFVVTTTSNPNLKLLDEFSKRNKNVKILKNIDYMAKQMKEVDLAIISASTVLHESIFMKLPFIAIKTAENQGYMQDYLLKKNLAVLDSSFKEKDFLKEFNKLKIKGKKCRIF